MNDILNKIRRSIALKDMPKNIVEVTSLDLVVDINIQENTLVLDKLSTENYGSV